MLTYASDARMDPRLSDDVIVFLEFPAKGDPVVTGALNFLALLVQKYKY